MPSQRRIEALRNLAERPGTSHEGALAREKLKRLNIKPDAKVEHHSAFIDLHRWPLVWQCECGKIVKIGEKCDQHVRHEGMRMQTAVRFKKGDRVFYNGWAYKMNCPATVVGMPKPDTNNWGWIRLKFDHLKQARNVPIFWKGGCNLSHQPLSDEEAERFHS